MIQIEFDEWLRYTQECFTGIEPWLSRITKMGENPPTRKGVLHKWFLALQDVSLSAAKDATAKIHRGEIEEPKGFDRLPAAIRKASGVTKKHFERSWDHDRYDADGNQTYSCLTCFDQGWVFCWHPVSMKAVTSGNLGEPFTLYSVVVFCNCEAGRDRGYRQEGSRFDSRFWLPLYRVEGGHQIVGDMSSPTEQHRLIDWMISRRGGSIEPVAAGQSELFSE